MNKLSNEIKEMKDESKKKIDHVEGKLRSLETEKAEMSAKE